MAIASLAAQGAGVGMNAVGSYYGALNRKRDAEFQARMARINADLAESDARAALGRGERQEQASRLENAQLKSRQRVGYASSGVDLGSDTAVDALTSTDVMGEVDANTIKANALRQAWGHRIEATGLRGQAGMAEASAEGISPWMEAGTSLLAGASQVHSSFQDFKRSGALDKSKKAWGDRADGFLSGLRGL
ncbi:hypothetical protein [Henriciella sp.]|uniref:hypothetical protein n=1 Tax=Henriciella sp. TaxID=1968823 RepID=UPI002633AC9A|nr:hypothetical protein [Henriciella sp.]